jgi:hypothetical protein
MANVLGELFADIAAAIRSKTGEEGSMKPTDFPSKIDSIASRDLSLLPIKFKKGGFAPNSSIYTIEHNLGCIPDIFIVYDTTVKTDMEPGTFLTFAIGFSRRMLDLLIPINNYPAEVAYALAYEFDGKLSGMTLTASDNSSITDCTEKQQEYGNLRSATDTICVIGGTFAPMSINIEYRYIAIGGLF